MRPPSACGWPTWRASSSEWPLHLHDILDRVTLADLAAALGCPFEGDGSLNLVRVATIEQAGPGDLTFLSNMKYARALADTRASVVIAAPGIDGAPCAVIRSDEPYVTLARAAALLMPAERPDAGVHPLASVAPDAEVDASASIGAFAVVGAKGRVGARTIVHPHAVIGPGTNVGADLSMDPTNSPRFSGRDACAR